MRILIWTPGFYPQWGGIETVTKELAYRLKERHEILVLTSVPGSNLPTEEYIDGIKIVRVSHLKKQVKKGIIRDYFPSPRNYLLRKIALFKIISTVNKFAPDVLNIHLSRQILPYVTEALPHIHFKKLVLSLHGDELFINYQEFSINKIIQTYHSLFYKVDNALFCSRWLLNYVSRNHEIDLCKCSVIFNGIDSEIYSTISSKVENKKKYIFAMGRFAEEKGFDLLIRAYAEIQVKYPELLLVLGGSGSLKQSYEQLITELNIVGKVHFPGYLEGEEKAKYLKEADLIVIPSRMDALNIVVLESIASGNSIVATNVGGIPEAGGDLVHYAEPNVESLTKAIKKALNAPPPDMQKVRAHLANLTVEKMVDKYEGVFKEACGKD